MDEHKGLGEQGVDYARTEGARRQSWFGLKRHVKRFMGFPAPHAVLRGALRVVPPLRSGRWPAPNSVREVIGSIGTSTFVMLRPDRCEIAKELYWGQGRRPKPEDALALEVVVQLVSEADVLLDVGAYTGLFTLAATAANTGLRVHAFEIVPAVASALQENLARNDVTDRVHVHLEGIGAPGTSMRVPRGEGGSALPSFYSSRLRFDEGERIRFRSLDSVSELVRPDASVVMKIDVEGTEASVFRYGQGFLSRFRPSILCEVLHGVANGEELEELLSPHRYKYYLVRSTDLMPSARVAPDPRYRDWLFTPLGTEELRAVGVPVATAVSGQRSHAERP